MGTGPGVSDGYDIALTEVIDGETHHFIAEAGSDEGSEILASLVSRDPLDEELVEARRMVVRASEHMGRFLETDGLKDLLQGNLENPYWDEIAKRCLSCTNCTLVCPTCFCSSVEDHLSLDGTEAERLRTSRGSSD